MLPERVLLAAIILGLSSGCAGNGPSSGGGGPPDASTSFESIQQTIFNVHCVNSGCHDSTFHQNNLVLVDGQSYGALVNVLPTNPAAQAAGLLRVSPGQPDRSFLLIKLMGPGVGEGSLMPSGSAMLSAQDVERIRSWILAGAPAGGSPQPTDSPTPTATETLPPTSTVTLTPTPTLSPTATASPTVTATPSHTLPPSPTFTGTLQPTPTVTNTVPPTVTPTPTASPSPTVSPTPSASPTPSPVPTPTFSLASTLPQIQADIFTTTCIGAGCHNAHDAANGQVLEAGQAYASLVGVPPTNAAARAAGFLRVDPGRPENSFLITKLTLPGAIDPLYGLRMPSGQTPLSAQQIEAIRAWILRGALPDETPP